MKKNIIVIVIACLAATLFFVHHEGHGQNETFDTEMEKVFEKKVDELKAVRDTWKTKRDVNKYLTILVGILGIVAGTLQRFEKKRWCEILVIIVGTGISIITVINNTYFEADYRTYSKLIHEGDKLIRQIELDLELTPDIDIVEKIKAFHELEARLIALTSQDSDIIPEAYAQQQFQGPSWMSSPSFYEDKGSLYFIGTADEKSFKMARDISYENAKNKAFEYFSKKHGERISEYIVKLPTIEDYFFTQKDNEEFTYHTLIRFNKRFLESATVLYQYMPEPESEIKLTEFAAGKHVAGKISGITECDKHKIIAYAKSETSGKWERLPSFAKVTKQLCLWKLDMTRKYPPDHDILFFLVSLNDAPPQTFANMTEVRYRTYCDGTSFVPPTEEEKPFDKNRHEGKKRREIYEDIGEEMYEPGKAPLEN